MIQRLFVYAGMIGLLFTSCGVADVTSMRSYDMERVELGMTKSELTGILGTAYTIAEKRIEAQDTIEVLSYRNFPHEEELYLFTFKNSQLMEWNREIQPEYKVVKE